MESIRQQQIGKIIKVALSEIFQREVEEILGGAFVTVLDVKITPDLQIARAYLSVYNVPSPDDIIGIIDHNNKAIRRLLGNRIRNKVRKIPELEFFRDNTMDEVVKIEKIFKEIRKKDDEVEELRKNSDFVDTNPYKEDLEDL